MSFSSGFSLRGLFEGKDARTGRSPTGLPADPTGQRLRSQGQVAELGGFSPLVCDSWPHGRGRGELKQMGGNFAKPPALLYKVKKPLKNACGRSTRKNTKRRKTSQKPPSHGPLPWTIFCFSWVEKPCLLLRSQGKTLFLGCRGPLNH